MSLQLRLTLLFTLVLILPLAVAGGVLRSGVVVLILSILAFAALAYLIAKLVTRPLRQLATGARALAEGRFDHRLDIEAEGEIGELAIAFNDTASRLSETIAELSASRAQLQQAVQQVAKTFRSTHNMEQILEALVDTAVQAVQADAAVLWRFAPTRQELYPAVRRGLSEELPNVRLGRGLVGVVAERGTPLLETQQDREHGEVHADYRVAIATPYYSRDRIQGVMVLLRKDPDRPFSNQDLSTAVFLSEQASVAIENVALHQEAQRLSLTDGLTGVWNRRFLQMQFRQVLASAVRFGRSFSVLMLDLDEFKRVNDTYGHQRGDATLIEFSRRVNATLREVDTFARYGGEEFVCLLPETDYPGAIITAEKIRDATKSEPFGEEGEEPLTVTVSIGMASYPSHGRSFSSLLEAADQALYRAKQEGRDRVVVADGGPPNLTSVG